MFIGSKTIDMDGVVTLLSEKDPISLGGFDDESGRPLLMMMFILPEYEQEARDFALSIIEKHKQNHGRPKNNKLNR